MDTVIVPWVEPDRFATGEGIAALADELADARTQAAARGIRLGYHNHEFEPAARDAAGTTGLERLFELAGPELVAEVDIYWATVGGVDPAALITALGSRVRLLHIKDGPADSADRDAPQVAVGAGRVDVAGAIAAGSAVGVAHRGARPLRDRHDRGVAVERAVPRGPGALPGPRLMSDTAGGRVGIIGCGNISRAYATKLRTLRDLDLVACADLDPARARSLAAEFDVPVVLTADELLAHPDVDVVVNLTVPLSRTRRSRRPALEAGKHVYSEKPLALDTRDGAQLVALAHEQRPAPGLRARHVPGRRAADVSGAHRRGGHRDAPRRQRVLPGLRARVVAPRPGVLLPARRRARCSTSACTTSPRWSRSWVR